MSAAGRPVEIDAERLLGWVERFRSRHGELAASLSDLTGEQLVLTALDGAEARLAVPFGRLPPPTDTGLDALLTTVRDHLERPRTLGVVLVRRAGWAVGVVADGDLAASRVGGGHVQGRTKAGGWSQQRFARRRAQQAQQVYGRAIAAAVDLLLPPTLDAVVTGGDRSGVAAVLADPRLAGLTDLVEPRFLAVGEPTRAVLDAVVRRLRAVVITLNELA
jgi:hypothetical protein